MGCICDNSHNITITYMKKDRPRYQELRTYLLMGALVDYSRETHGLTPVVSSAVLSEREYDAVHQQNRFTPASWWSLRDDPFPDTDIFGNFGKI